MAKAKNDELVDEIETIRLRLADTVDELIDRTNPKNVARRGVNDIKGHFIDEKGSPRLENIVPVLGGVAAVVGAIIVLRRFLR